MEEAKSVLENLVQLSEEHYILYIDCNNLYGTAMCEPMPLDSFWMEKQGEADNPLIYQEEEGVSGYERTWQRSSRDTGY